MTRLFRLVTAEHDSQAREVTYHGCEAVGSEIVLAANEGRSYIDAVNVRTGKHTDSLTDTSRPCCIERIPGTNPVRVLVSNIGDGTLGVVEVSSHGKMKSLGKIKVGKAPKRVAFIPSSSASEAR